MTSRRSRASTRAVQHTNGNGASVASPAPAGGRLEQLYEISKLFMSFENIDQTFEPALDIVTRTLPLRTAILIQAEEGHARMVVWRSEGQSNEQQRAVKQQVEAAYRYLVASGSTESLNLSERAGKTALPRLAETDAALGKRFIVLPLVVPHGAPFGTLALEGARTLDKADLMFVNVIANQLAIVLDRSRAWQAEITRRERAEEDQTHAEAMSDQAERERALAESLRDKSEALAADNARLYRQAQQAVRMRDQILAVVSHDLRNPLGTILLTTGLLAKQRVPEERRRGLPSAVARIARAAERMQRLIEDLLDFASIESGRLAITRARHDAGAIINETLASFEHDAQDQHLLLTADIAPHLPQISCDQERILQVLSNLVGNATKATPAGGNICIRVQAQQNDFLFSVSDDGQGIGAEDLRHLFERYWRSDEAHYRGTGLGLAIAEGLITAHGGRIWAESQLGHGATFWFTLPGAGYAPD